MKHYITKSDSSRTRCAERNTLQKNTNRVSGAKQKTQLKRGDENYSITPIQSKRCRHQSL